MLKHKPNNRITTRLCLLSGGVSLLALFTFLYFIGALSLPFRTASHPAPFATEEQGAVDETIPPRNTPEETAKRNARSEKLRRLKEQASVMGVSLQGSGWLLLTDEQGQRQGYADASTYYDEIPVAYQPLLITGGLPRIGPPVQSYKFTETVPFTATIIGKETGTFVYSQTVNRHWLLLDNVPTREGVKDTIQVDASSNRFSIHFDPVDPARRGHFQLWDRMNYLKSMGKHITFNGKGLPVIPGATLTFTDDIDTLLAGEKGMTITIDRDSDGKAEQSVTVGGGQLTVEDYRQIFFTPDSQEFKELFEANPTTQPNMQLDPYYKTCMEKGGDEFHCALFSKSPNRPSTNVPVTNGRWVWLFLNPKPFIDIW